ncbi:MAG: glycosyltransferase [Actinomycetota bacterium]|nr:glycosyltransferase [Actinomycetota bacterium]
MRSDKSLSTAAYDSETVMKRRLFDNYYVGVNISDFVAVALIVATSLTVRAILHQLQRKVVAKPDLKTASKVSVLIPARNEGASIFTLLSSLATAFRGSDFSYEVIVANDGSTDETAAVAMSFDFVQVIDVAAGIRSGINGKSNALFAAFEHASGDILVFLDADVRVGDKFLSAIRTVAGDSGIDLLSVQPHHNAQTLGESFALTFNIVSLYSSLISNRSHRRPQLAFGPVFVTKRKCYLAAGGHAMILGEVVDDVALSRLYFESALKVVTLLDKRLATFRMYPFGFRQMVEGFTKNFVAGATSLSPLGSLVGFGYIFAFLALDISIVRDFIQLRIVRGLFLYAVTTCLIAFEARVVGRFKVCAIALHPLTFCIFVFVFVRALLRRALSLPNTWKGRAI